jgi:histidyl-tRNA synthetase
VELGLVAEHQTRTQVLVALFDESTAAASLQVANKLRQAGIATEVYPSFDKLGKQFKLADQKLIPWVVIVGENEIANNTVSAKNMASGEQITENLETLITRFS